MDELRPAAAPLPVAARASVGEWPEAVVDRPTVAVDTGAVRGSASR
jgi:hypothetical protein